MAWLAYVWVGYPIALRVIASVRRFHPVSSDTYHPAISVLIAARNEERDIGWKLAETLAWDYPPDRLEILVGSDASTDGTDQAIRSIRDARVRLVRNEERSGKNETLNRLVGMATGEILLFTDANTHIERQCLRKVVRHFADARVGCVTGLEQNVPDLDSSALTIGSCTYLGYESVVDRLESTLGSVIVCDGSIYAMRASLWSNLDPDLANDLEHPVRVGASGSAILYEPEARSFERCTSSAWEEFVRRRRIAGQGALAMWRLRHQLKGIRLWQFVSRKLMRWLTLVPLGVVLISSVNLRHDLWFTWFLSAQVMFYAVACAGGWLPGKTRVGALLRTPFVVMLAYVAVFCGVVDACRGKRFATWNIATLSRGTNEALS